MSGARRPVPNLTSWREQEFVYFTFFCEMCKLNHF